MINHKDYLKLAVLPILGGVCFMLLTEALYTSKVSINSIFLGILIGLILTPIRIVLKFNRELKPQIKSHIIVDSLRGNPRCLDIKGSRVPQCLNLFCALIPYFHSNS